MAGRVAGWGRQLTDGAAPPPTPSALLGPDGGLPRPPSDIHVPAARAYRGAARGAGSGRGAAAVSRSGSNVNNKSAQFGGRSAGAGRGDSTASRSDALGRHRQWSGRNGPAPTAALPGSAGNTGLPVGNTGQPALPPRRGAAAPVPLVPAVPERPPPRPPKTVTVNLIQSAAPPAPSSNNWNREDDDGYMAMGASAQTSGDDQGYMTMIRQGQEECDQGYMAMHRPGRESDPGYMTMNRPGQEEDDQGYMTMAGPAMEAGYMEMSNGAAGTWPRAGPGAADYRAMQTQQAPPARVTQSASPPLPLPPRGADPVPPQRPVGLAVPIQRTAGAHSRSASPSARSVTSASSWRTAADRTPSGGTGGGSWRDAIDLPSPVGRSPPSVGRAQTQSPPSAGRAQTPPQFSQTPPQRALAARGAFGSSNSLSSIGSSSSLQERVLSDTATAGSSRRSWSSEGRASSQPWYQRVSRGKAEELLIDQPDGRFLIRPTTKPGAIATLSVALHFGCRHLPVRRRADGRVALGQMKDDERAFDSLEALVEYHREIPLVVLGVGDTRLTGTV